MTLDGCCHDFMDNGQDVFRGEKIGQITLLKIIDSGSKSFLLKKTWDRYRFANEDKGAFRIAILD